MLVVRNVHFHCYTNKQVLLIVSLWSFFCSLLTVPVRPITSALHKRSLNDKGERYGLPWFILICGSGRHIRVTLMGVWVTSNSFLLSLCPLTRCEENLSRALLTQCTPLGIPWPFSSDRLGHAQFNPSLLLLHTPHPSITPAGSTYTVKTEVMLRLTIICRKASFIPSLYVVSLPTGRCWLWAVV